MKKLRYAGRDQIEMRMMSLDEMLPEDHLAREIWAYVEGMDLSELVAEVASAEGEAGAPAFDPRTLMGLWLYATADSVGSARRLSRLVEESLPYRWLTGGEAINYHTLSDFRVRHAEVLDRLLVASVAVLAREGRLDLENLTVAHDGMRVRASAGRDSMRRRPALEQALEQARTHVERMKKDHDSDEDPPGARQKAARERAARERAERLAQALAAMDKLEAKQRTRTDRKPQPPRVSWTDPDAALMHMPNGGKDVAHNVQFTTETRTRAVVAVTVAAAGSGDTGTLAPGMKNFGRAHGRPPTRVLADQGFFKYADIAALESRRCEVLMPDPYPKSRNTQRWGRFGAPIAVWRERMKTERAQEQYKLRSSTVEWSNARVRQQGLLQLTVRGRAKVLAVGLWHALTHNIRRTMALRRESAMPAAA